MAFPAVTMCLDMNMDQYYLYEDCMKKNVCSNVDAKMIERLTDLGNLITNLNTFLNKIT